LVLVSGLPPIRAKKLRYYEDDNFKGRILSPPVLAEGSYADCPPHAPHDWEGQVRNSDTRLEKPWFSQLHGSEGEEGGLTREPWNEQQAPVAQEPVPSDDLSLLDDDFGFATANTDPMARSAAQRSFGVNNAEGDDALPLF
jgi:type IV secretion system protein VirD4